jgi:hypothetical protein
MRPAVDRSSAISPRFHGSVTGRGTCSTPGMALIETIDPTLLATVIGGDMQFSPSLSATLESHLRRPKTNEPSKQMLQLVNGLGTAMSNLTTGMSQAKQQSSQAMMQALPQMMQR